MYQSLTYKLVIRNRLYAEKEGKYHKTAVYWLADGYKSLDELWERERPRVIV